MAQKDFAQTPLAQDFLRWAQATWDSQFTEEQPQNWHPGDNEAAAAISGMQDTYGSSYGPPNGFAVGERVTYRSAAGDEEARGVIVEVLDELAGSYHIKIRVPGSEPVHRFAADAELAYF